MDFSTKSIQNTLAVPPFIISPGKRCIGAFLQNCRNPFPYTYGHLTLIFFPGKRKNLASGLNLFQICGPGVRCSEYFRTGIAISSSMQNSNSLGTVPWNGPASSPTGRAGGLSGRPWPTECPFVLVRSQSSQCRDPTCPWFQQFEIAHWCHRRSSCGERF